MSSANYCQAGWGHQSSPCVTCGQHGQAGGVKKDQHNSAVGVMHIQCYVSLSPRVCSGSPHLCIHHYEGEPAIRRYPMASLRYSQVWTVATASKLTDWS